MGVSGLGMSQNEAGWRTQNAGRVLALATAMFERDILRVTQVGEFGWITRAYVALFRNLDLDGTRLTDLATRAGITKQSMQELVDKAEAFGVVERRPAPDDRRAKIVTFTPTGLRMLEQFRKGVEEAEQRLASVMGAAFLAEMKTRLADYVEAADEAVAGADQLGADPTATELPAVKRRRRS